MNEHIYLSTYVIKAKSKLSQTEQLLEQFNGTNDLLVQLDKLLKDLLENPRTLRNDEERGTNINFTLAEPHHIDSDERLIYGRFETALVGEPLYIKDFVERKQVFEGNRERHGNAKKLFFFIKLPRLNKKGYFIIQKQARFGLKTAFQQSLATWIRDEGFMDTYIQVSPILNGQVFYQMLDKGNLKEIGFVTNKIPGSLDKLFKNDFEGNEEKGKLITKLQSKTSLSDKWKEFIRKNYSKSKNSRIGNVVFEEDLQQFDEVEIKLELNGKNKTFYMNNKGRALPDLDISNGAEYKDGQPTTEYMLRKCQEAIEDVYETKINVS